jgi:hypothetical protein
MQKLGLLLLVLLLNFHLLAEGTKELCPANETLSMQISKATGSYGPFATAVAPSTARLQFSILSTTEKVFFGFKNANTQMTYVIKDDAGNLVTPLPITLPTTVGSNGYINDYEQACTGPSTVASGGYPPLTFNPPYPGHFYIEFDWTDWGDSKTFSLFDITVANASNQALPGRVWSRNWQFSTGSFANLFNGKMYPYSDDGIVTEIDFNGLAPYTFNISCNPKGCFPDIPFEEARKSVGGNHTYSQYRIFVNEADSLIFPSGVMGSVDSVTTDNLCNGNLNFSVYVNKSGLVDIVLDINPLPGFQAEDLSLTDSVFAGVQNIITWDGLDGLGNPVENGITIQVITSYVNGLTNLPLYDAENDVNSTGKVYPGMIINLIRPTGIKPKTYWDDTQVNGTTQLGGCLDPTGCHSWGNSVGNNNTINTWWFSLSITLTPVSLTYRRSHFFEQDTAVCQGDSVQFFGNWYNSTTTVYDSAINFMGCDSVHVAHLVVNGIPPGALGSNVTICQGQSLVLDAGAGTGYSYLWNTGATSQTISVNTSGNFTVLVTTPQGCTSQDEVAVYVSPPPSNTLIKHN